MAIHQKPYFWKQLPFVRLIIPFISGILLQSYLNISPAILIIAGFSISVILLSYNFLPIAIKYKTRSIAGFAMNVLFAIIAGYLIYNKDIRHGQEWFGNFYTDSIAVLATIQEPVIEKAKTYKAEASIESIKVNGEWKPVSGKVLMYFSKDTNAIKLNYGSQVLFQ